MSETVWNQIPESTIQHASAYTITPDGALILPIRRIGEKRPWVEDLARGLGFDASQVGGEKNS